MSKGIKFRDQLKYLARDFRAMRHGEPANQYSLSRFGDLVSHIEEAYKNVLGKRYFPAADTGRLRADWQSNITSTYNFIQSDYKILVGRSKLAFDTDPYAQSAVSVLDSQIVGAGIRPSPKPKEIDGTYNQDLGKQLKALWDRFNDEFLRDRSRSFYESQSAYIRGGCVSGGMIWNTIPNRKNSLLPFAFQEIDQAQLDFTRDISPYSGLSPDNTTNLITNKIYHGIRLNEYMEPIEYYFDGITKAIPAENIIHAFVKRHINQVIGIPWLAPALSVLYDLQQLQEDKIISSRVASAIALWMHRNDRSILKNLKDNNATQENVDWSPGSILTSETKPEIIQAESILDAFKPLLDVYLRSVAVSVGISYPELTSDIAGANFASSRVIILDRRRSYNQRQKIITRSPSKQVYQKFVQWAFLTGLIPGKSISDYHKNQWGYCEALWTPQPFDWVDPLKDINALKEEKNAGWLTDEQYFQEQGMDSEEVYERLAYEKKRKTELGINQAEAQQGTGQGLNQTLLTGDITNE